MTLIVLQRQHQIRDEINGYQLENIKLNAVKHDSKYSCRPIVKVCNVGSSLKKCVIFKNLPITG
jgi:hypothetical protein